MIHCYFSVARVWRKKIFLTYLKQQNMLWYSIKSIFDLCLSANISTLDKSRRHRNAALPRGSFFS